MAVRDNGGTENAGRDLSRRLTFRITARPAPADIVSALQRRFIAEVEEIEDFRRADALIARMNTVIENIDDDFRPSINQLNSLSRTIRGFVSSGELSEDDGEVLLEITAALLEHFRNALESADDDD